jgi:hypothetical protein
MRYADPAAGKGGVTCLVARRHRRVLLAAIADGRTLENSSIFSVAD